MSTKAQPRRRARKLIVPLTIGLGMVAPIAAVELAATAGIAQAAPQVSVVGGITAAVSGPSQVTVNWGFPVLGVPASAPVTGYRVIAYKSTPASGIVVNLPASAHTTTFSGLTPGANYRFRVMAINAWGLGAPADSAKVTVIDTPIPVTNLSAVNMGGVLVQWDYFGGVKTGTPTGFKLVARNASNGVVQTVTVPGSVLSYGFDSSVASQIVTVEVFAINRVGTGPGNVVGVSQPGDWWW